MTTEVQEPKTMVEAMVRTAGKQLLIRTMLSVSASNYGHFTAHIFMAEGHVAGKVDRLLHIRAEQGNSQLPARLCGLRVSPGNKAEHLIAEWAADQQIRSAQNEAPWFEHWLSPEPYVGVLLLDSDYSIHERKSKGYRRMSPENIGHLVYFGSIATGLSMLANERSNRELNEEEERTGSMLGRLAERFGQFMWAQQRKVLETAYGVGWTRESESSRIGYPG